MAGLFVLVLLLALGHVFEMLPMVVLAAVMIVMTVTIMDFQFVQDIKSLSRSGFEGRSQAGVNLFLELLVATLVVTVDIFVALAFGLGLSIGLFVLNMSKQIVRHMYEGSQLPSNVVRQVGEEAFLQERANQIRVLELEGVLFFGTADKLHDHLDPLVAGDVEVIILDLSLVTQIDQTAVDILLQCNEKCHEAGREFALSAMTKTRAVARFPDLVPHLISGELRSFGTSSDALEWAEQYLLSLNLGRGYITQEIELSQVNVLRNMSPEQIETLNEHLVEKKFNEDDYIIREGKSERILYMLVKGEAIVGSSRGGEFFRYITIRAGSVVGEMSLFDNSQRSADVIAKTDVHCFALTSHELKKLRLLHPETAYEFLVGLNLINADHLRRANSIIERLR